jgi:tetratricopeptide (TPR) repeat protein
MIKWRILLTAFTVLSSITLLNCSRDQGDDPAEAKALDEQVDKLYQQGRYAEAIPLAIRALAIHEKALGPDHPNVAALYDSLGEDAKAEPLYKRALAIVEKAFGPEHPDVATVIENMSEFYTKMGKTEESKKLAARAAKIR